MTRRTRRAHAAEELRALVARGGPLPLRRPAGAPDPAVGPGGRTRWID